MLIELKVSHFATIDSLRVNFLKPGLNVLTGETGAGKSVILKSLSLLISGKATPDVIRTGQNEAIIEGALDLSDRPDIRKHLKNLDLDSGDSMLVVRRILSREGKSRIYINGHLSTLNVLTSLVSELVEITGQHEHHSLTQPASQLGFLDRFAGTETLALECREKFGSLSKLKSDLESLRQDAGHRQQKIDFLSYQVQEIESFQPTPGEDQVLASQYQRARHFSKLSQFAASTLDALHGRDNSLHSQIQDFVRTGESLIELDQKLKPIIQNLKEASLLIEDTSFGLRDYAQEEAFDSQDIEKLEDRLSSLRKLQKKYGNSIDEIIAFKSKASAELLNLTNFESREAELESEIQTLEKTLVQKATDLSKKRAKAAAKLQDQVNKEMKDLNMKGVELLISSKAGETLHAMGFDEVSFLFRNSPQDEPKPISKVASGGELSRLMLSLKQTISAAELPMTYLFDEVDSGVSGPTAEKVGMKLKRIGRNHQVICITHLPQVASFGDAHFLITKEVEKSSVKSDVRELNLEERVKELGRLISGKKITATSLAHAREMIESNRSLN